MAETQQRSEQSTEQEATTPALPSFPGDSCKPRKPYERPRLLKKRSLARATLFTVMGVTMSGLTTMG